KVMRFHFRESGRDVLLLQPSAAADSHDAQTRFGSSEYAKEVLGEIWGLPPALNLQGEAALQKCVLALIDKGIIESAHDCSDGGLAVALAESAFVKGIGAKVSLNSDIAAEIDLFGENASRILLSCDPNKTATIKQIAVEFGLSAEKIGGTSGDQLAISINGHPVIAAKVADLKQSWSGALQSALHTETPEHLVPEVLQKS